MEYIEQFDSPSHYIHLSFINFILVFDFFLCKNYKIYYLLHNCFKSNLKIQKLVQKIIVFWYVQKKKNTPDTSIWHESIVHIYGIPNI